METEGLDPYIKKPREGHHIINFKGLSCAMDTMTNVSDPNAIRVARHLTIRRKRKLLNLNHDHKGMWANYFLHKSLSTGKRGTKPISLATVARAIQIMVTDEDTLRSTLLPRIPK